MKTLNELKLESLSEEEIIQEISLGTIAGTVLVGRLLHQVKGIKDKPLQDSLRSIGYMLYAIQLTQRKQMKSRVQKQDFKRKRIKTW